jgi:hypothetical protein
MVFGVLKAFIHFSGKIYFGLLFQRITSSAMSFFLATHVELYNTEK